MDTVKTTLRDNPRVITDETPTTVDRLPESQLKERYRVSLMVPFKADVASATPVDEEYSLKELRFINFYAGVKLALKELSTQGVQLDVDVYDTRDRLTEVKKLADLGNISSSDLIIGPYDKEGVKWMANWAKRRQITMVSPWISSTTIAEDNPFYVQMKPGLLKHYETLVDQGLMTEPDRTHYMVYKEGDDNKKRYMAYTLKQLDMDLEVLPYEEIELIPDSLTYGQIAFDSTIFKGRDCHNVFMVPYASSKDAGFVYDFLRKVQIEQGDCKSTIFGMYRWLDYQDEMFDLLNAMDVRMTISNLANPEDGQVKSFKRKYLNTYGALPTDDALEGYDMMIFLGKNLEKHGTYWQFETMDADPQAAVQTVFHILPERDSETGRIQYFENYFLDLIKVEDFKYKRAVD